MIREESILLISSKSLKTDAISEFVKYCKRAQSNNCVSSSARDPFATFKNRINSRVPRDCPSAIFDGMETAARRI